MPCISRPSRDRPAPSTLIVLGAAAFMLAACASPTAPGATVATTSHPPAAAESEVGAVELDEPPLHLTTVDAAGRVAQLDLSDETVAEIGDIDPPVDVATDGRYLFASGPTGVTVVDSGMWTWDHGDHDHYYRSEPRILGIVPGAGPAAVATTTSSTTGGTGLFFAESGSAVLLDTEALSTGEIAESFRIEVAPHDGLVVPIGAFALVTDGEGSVTVHASDGSPLPDTTTSCTSPRASIATGVGAVLGCDGGALLATLQNRTVTLERIPYPEGVGPVTSLANREGRPVTAGLDDDGRILLLDTRNRTWTPLRPPGSLLQVTAVDDEARHVLALDDTGRVLVLRGEDGAVLAATEPLLAESVAAGALASVTLIADDRHAYLNDPSEGLVYEIDIADARIARVLPTGDPPAHLALTGR